MMHCAGYACNQSLTCDCQCPDCQEYIMSDAPTMKEQAASAHPKLDGMNSRMVLSRGAVSVKSRQVKCLRGQARRLRKW